MSLLDKSKQFYSFFLFLLLLLVWQIFSGYKIPGFNLHLLPSPSTLVFDFIKLVNESDGFLSDIFVSSLRVISGFVLAAIFGVSLGLLSYENKKARLVIMPIINIIRPIPNIVWLPIVIVLFSSLTWSIIAIPFLGAFPPILISTFAGAKTLPKIFLYKARLNDIKKFDYLKDILIPWVFPYMRNGMNIGISNAWLGVVLAEMTAGRDGLGYFTWISFQSNSYSLMLIGAISIGAMGYLSSHFYLYLTKDFYYARARQRENC